MEKMTLQLVIICGFQMVLLLAQNVPGDFPNTPKVTLISTHSTHFVIALHQWTNNMTGDVPPSSYVVYMKSSKAGSNYTNIAVALHDPDTDTVEVVVDRLSTSEAYQFKILAQHENIVLKELSSVGVSLNLPPESYETIELGCFHDDYPYGRALTAGPYKVSLKLPTADSMSPAKCIKECWKIGYVYSGVEYGFECHCGDNSDYDRFGKLNSSNCNYGCNNNYLLDCGGFNAIWITLAFRTTTTELTSVLTKASTEPITTVSGPLASTTGSLTVANTVHDNSTFYNKTGVTLFESSTAALRNTSIDRYVSQPTEKLASTTLLPSTVETHLTTGSTVGQNNQSGTSSAPVCVSKNVTQYLTHGDKTVDVDVGSNQVLSLEAGNHTYTRLSNDGNCTIRVSVIRAVDTVNADCPSDTIGGLTSVTTGLGTMALMCGSIKHRLSLPVGVYKYDVFNLNGRNCTSSVKISDYFLKRRMEFRARFSMNCDLLSNPITKTTLKSVADSHFNQMEGVCEKDCSSQKGSEAHIDCDNGTLVIKWPTDQIYSGDVTKVPSEVQSKLIERLSRITDKVSLFQVVLINHLPPVVHPFDTSFILTSYCQNNKAYDVAGDRCL